jgi:ribosomal protein L24
MKVKKDDKVVVLSARTRQRRQGHARRASEIKVVVQGVSIAMKHQKPSQSGRTAAIAAHHQDGDSALRLQGHAICPKCASPRA